MGNANIIIVEDELIVALDLKNLLEGFGYIVSAISPSGEDALNKIKELKPNLVLMDIKLKGKMNGIEAAEIIRDNFNVPVVYLTANADTDTVNRAKTSQPYGFIHKPIVVDVVRSAIEMALYKHDMEQFLKEREAGLDATLQSIGEAVISTDIEGCITNMNRVAVDLTGWAYSKALGKPLLEIFNIVNAKTRKKEADPIKTVIAKGKRVELTKHTMLIAKDGTEYHIADSASPISDKNGKIIGVVLVFRDVTQEYKTQEEIRRSKIQLESSIESPEDMIILSLDREYKYLYFNKAHAETMAQVYGTQPKIGDCIFTHMKVEDDIAKVKIHYDRALAGERHIAIEEYGEGKLRFYYEIHYNPVFDTKNTIIGITAFAQNITERKRAENAMKTTVHKLKESEKNLENRERYYRSLIYNLHEDIVVIDTDYNIVDLNNSVLVTTGKKRNEIIGQKCFEVFHNYPSPCDQYGEPCSFREVFDTGESCSCLHRHTLSDGSFVFVDIILSPIRDDKGRITHVIEAMRNVSDMIEIQEMLREERDKAQKYLDIAGVMLIALDVDQKVNVINPKGCEILGYGEDEIIGQNWFDKFLPDKNIIEIKKVFNQIIAGDINPVEYYENPIVRKDGSLRHIAWHNSILRDRQGKIIGLFSSGEDITERKRAEAERDRILELSLDLICIAGIDGYFKYVNPAWKDVLGYTAKELIERPFLEFIHPDDHNKNDAEVAKLAAGQKTIDFENRYIHKDGSVRTISWVAAPLLPEGLLYCIGRDITESKKMAVEREQLLHDVKERVKELQCLYMVAELIQTQNSIGEILQSVVEALPAFWQYPDISRAKIIFEEGVYASGKFKETKWKLSSPLVINEEASGVVEVYYLKDRPEINEGPFMLEERSLIDGVARILSHAIERLQAEDKVKDSEEKYRTYIDNAPEGIFVVDAKGNYIDVNRGACRMVGYSREELLSMAIKQISSPNTPAESLGTFSRLKETGKIEAEMFLRKKDGSDIPVLLKAVALSDNRFMAFCSDITARHKADAEIQNNLQEKEVMLKEIHHRVKNNMQVISSILRLQLDDIHDEAAKERLKHSGIRIKSIALVHEELYRSTNLSKIEFSNYLRKLSTHVLSIYSNVAEKIELDYNLKEVFLNINKAIPLGLIANELLTNSVTHGFTTGRLFDQKPTAKNKILISFCQVNNSYYELLIQDNGIGFPIGLDFRKTESLGLQIVRDLVKQIDGSISLVRRGGTKWKITFPVEKSSKPG